MGAIKSIIFLLISIIISVYFTALEVNASSAFADLESNISPESSETKIKKLQTLFTQLDLYNGEIDGQYSSIAPSLIDFQINEGLVTHKDDWGAGYFGIKTIEILEKKYGDTFQEKKSIIQQDTPVTGEKYFYVTAYYSPLPGQNRYTTGSYAGDIRLNGRGTHTASGKGVYTGILAAPRNYKYGTKIHLQGIGVGAVEDRGGAIVNAGERGFEYDRIDVWMGYGDEGLLRALKWGKRKVKGQIVDSNNQVSIGFDESPVAKFNALRVSEESKAAEIKKLQELFSQLKLYDGGVDGKYESIKDELINYQVDKRIIKSRSSEQAGYFGPKTISSLTSDFGGGIFKSDTTTLIEQEAILTRKQTLEIYKIKQKIDKYINNKYPDNQIKKYAYKKKIRSRLETMLNKSKSKTTRAKLKYLKNII